MRPVNFGVRYTGCVHSSKVGKGNDDEAEHGLVLGHHGLVAVVGAGFVCGKLRDYGQGVQDSSTRTAYINGPQGEYEVSDLSVSLRIQKVQPHGRADSQCAAFKPRTSLKINISPVPRLAVKQGQQVRLHYFKKHNQGQEATESYQLLQP